MPRRYFYREHSFLCSPQAYDDGWCWPNIQELCQVSHAILNSVYHLQVMFYFNTGMHFILITSTNSFICHTRRLYKVDNIVTVPRALAIVIKTFMFWLLY